MKKIWSDFININANKHLAKDKFEDFCYQVLKKHFPNKKVFSVFDIKSITDTEHFFIVFLPMFFFDGLKEPRKGYIRKYFNRTIEKLADRLPNIYVWTVCSPYELKDDEVKWWLEWRKKQVDKYGINIQFFDGAHLIELSKKYRIFDYWFVDEVQNITDKKEDEKQKKVSDFFIEFVIEEDNTMDQTYKFTKEEEQKNAPFAEKSIPKSKFKEPKTQSTTEQNNKESRDEKQETESIEEQTDKHKLQEEKEKAASIEKNYKYFKSLYERLIQKLNLLSKEQLERYNKLIIEKTIRRKKDFFTIDFDKISNEYEQLRKQLSKDNQELSQGTIEEIEFDIIISIYRNAKTLYSQQIYDEALLYYELLLQYDYKKYLKNRASEIENTYKKLKKIVEAFIYLREGDFYYAQIEDINKFVFKVKEPSEKEKDILFKAKETYNTAYNLASDIKDIAEKYWTLVGDIAMIEQDFKTAELAYKKAYETFFENDLNVKYKYAKNLAEAIKNNKIKNLKSALEVLKSAKWDKNYTIDISNKITKLYFKKSLPFILGTIFLIFLFLYAEYKLFRINHQTEQTKIKTTKISDNENIQMYFDKAIKLYNLTNAHPHLYDTVYNMLNNLLKNYKQYIDKNKVIEYMNIIYRDKENYIQTMQKNILKNPKAYMVSMRTPTQNLRFVKVLFKPYDYYNGKYGYVDSANRLVIPPFFDFDFRKMKDTIPQFHKGTAIVCLILSTGQKKFYTIDTTGKLIREVRL